MYGFSIRARLGRGYARDEARDKVTGSTSQGGLANFLVLSLSPCVYILCKKNLYISIYVLYIINNINNIKIN